MTALQKAILAQLPRLRGDATDEYHTAARMQWQPDAHPLVRQASVRQLQDNLRTLARTGHCVCLRSYTGPRSSRIIGYAVPLVDSSITSAQLQRLQEASHNA